MELYLHNCRVDDKALKMYELNCGRCIKVLLPSLTRKLHNVAGDDILHPLLKLLLFLTSVPSKLQARAAV
jgi:hypothetical protein